MIAELCSHTIALDCRRSQPNMVLFPRSPVIAIACDRDRTRSQSCSHIIADDRWWSSAIACDRLRSYVNQALVTKYDTHQAVRTLIELHRSRKRKSESFASCRSRVNISGGSKIAWINVECNGIHCLLPFLRKLKAFAGFCDFCYSSLTGVNKIVNSIQINYLDQNIDQLSVGLLAQLVERCTGTVEVMGSNPKY